MKKSSKAAPRIGVHLGTAGGAFNAVERAREIGANTFQIFSSSPRMWRQFIVPPEHCTRMREARSNVGVTPLVVHASYLINLCSQSEPVRKNSIAAFRGEVERALALGADYLVLHPGSWRGLTRQQGLSLAADSIELALDGLEWPGCEFKVLIENTAGAEFSLGGSFENVAELVDRLKPCVPVAVCLDTCHTHVSGYDIVTADGYESTMRLIGDQIGFEAVRVWHCNDAKAAMGSKLDRHQHIGKGSIGLDPFRRLLNDPRFAHAAFIAETPVDVPDDDRRNVSTLKELVER